MKLLNSKSSLGGEGGSVFIAVPSYGGICAEFVYSLWASREEMAKAGIKSDLCIYDGNCHVDDSRNRLVREFLDSDCDQLVFLDTDLQWDALDLVRLASLDYDVVAGVYPMKQDEDEYPVRYLPGPEIWLNKDKLIEVESVPTGFLKISRDALQKLSDTVPKFTTRLNQKSVPLIFERTMIGNARFGGDYEFCRKWRNLGGKIFVDPEMKFGHMGMSEWHGSLGSHVRKENGTTEDYIANLVKQMAEHPPTPAEIAHLCHEWDNKWTAPVELLGALAMLAEETEGPILECGSGVSTLILGAIADRRGVVVDTLEHDSDWRHRVHTILKKVATSVPVNVWETDIVDGWYDFTPYSRQYSLVLVDGPTRKIGRNGLLKIKDSFAPGCVFIVDDAEEPVTDELRKIGVNFKADYGRYVIGKLEAEVPCQLQKT